jgi:SAM-dependent methyltransferase
MTNNAWYKDWFNSPYYYLLYFTRNEEEARQFITALINYLKPKEGAKVLDVACGKGRHSKILAQMGFDVTGFDLAENAIDAAKQFEAENLHFFLHDMRLPFWINYFDIAFNLFTSFGYFRTQREHDNGIRTIAQSLNHSGIFVIDYLNIHYAEDNLKTTEEKSIDGITFDINRWHTEDTFFKQIKIEDKAQTTRQEFTEKVHKFSLGDFTDMLAYNHFQVQEVFGDYSLAHYHVKKSPRMIIIAKKVQR